jgi:hypothetical protein
MICRPVSARIGTFAGHPNHAARVELAAIDAHRAAESAADLS